MRRALIILFLLISTGLGLKGQVKHVFPSDSLGIKSDTTFRIQTIKFIGNKQTKDKIIRREITFAEGEVFTRSELDKALQFSYENLKNTSLFNFIKVECHYLIDHSVAIIINLEERWYIWPFPVFDYTARNFSEFIKNQRWDRLNYGMYLRVENFRGRNEIIKIKAIAGYRKQLELFYYTPNLDKKQRFGLESYVTYFMWDDVEYNTFSNQMVSFKDTVNYEILRNEIESTTSLFYRKNYRDRHRLAFTYLYGNVADTIAELNPEYFGSSNTRFDYFRLIYHYYNDHRDYKYYPLNGFYWDAFAVNEFEQNTDFYNFYLQGSFRYYKQLSDRFYVSTGIKGKVSTATELPFYLNKGIGYLDYLRGFEEYVTNAPNYLVNKNNLKFEFIKNRTLNLSFLPFKKFNKIPFAAYVNLFIDSGYSYYKYPSPANSMQNSVLLSGGLSLDLVTYYDKVFSIGYSYTNFDFGYLFFHIEASGILSKN